MSAEIRFLISPFGHKPIPLLPSRPSSNKFAKCDKYYNLPPNKFFQLIQEQTLILLNIKANLNGKRKEKHLQMVLRYVSGR